MHTNTSTMLWFNAFSIFFLLWVTKLIRKEKNHHLPGYPDIVFNLFLNSSLVFFCLEDFVLKTYELEQKLRQSDVFVKEIVFMQNAFLPLMDIIVLSKL